MVWITENCKADLSNDIIGEVQNAEVFCDDHPAFADFSTRSLRPLIREHNNEVRENVISLVENAGKEKEMLYGTQKLMERAIKSARKNLRLPSSKKRLVERKLLSKTDQSEFTLGYVTKMLKAGVKEEVVRELVVKALSIARLELNLPHTEREPISKEDAVRIAEKVLNEI